MTRREAAAEFCDTLARLWKIHPFREGKPVLRSLKKYHGKPGHGASVEFKIKEGPTHHYALGIGHHANTIKKIADVLGIESVVVK